MRPKTDRDKFMSTLKQIIFCILHIMSKYGEQVHSVSQRIMIPGTVWKGDILYDRSMYHHIPEWSPYLFPLVEVSVLQTPPLHRRNSPFWPSPGVVLWGYHIQSLRKEDISYVQQLGNIIIVIRLMQHGRMNEDFNFDSFMNAIHCPWYILCRLHDDPCDSSVSSEIFQADHKKHSDKSIQEQQELNVLLYVLVGIYLAIYTNTIYI